MTSGRRGHDLAGRAYATAAVDHGVVIGGGHGSDTAMIVVHSGYHGLFREGLIYRIVVVVDLILLTLKLTCSSLEKINFARFKDKMLSQLKDRSSIGPSKRTVLRYPE